MTDITKFGAIGDGKTNCSPAIAKALETESEIYFPSGIYAITEELLIPSNRRLVLAEDATIFAADHCFDKAGVRAIITNADHIGGNENITIEGGKIDANNITNGRANWKDGPNMGVTFCFKRVKGLTVKNLISHNADSYNFHLCRVEDFCIEDITFSATHLPKCQDGVHVGGFCHHGVIRNIFAEYGCTNDDLLAFSADEIYSFVHNQGFEDGPISDIEIENVYAENCWSAIRILSFKSQISNLTFRNITAGVRRHGLNLDGSRYLGAPLFKDEDYPTGVGDLKNIVFENLTFWKTDRIWKEEVLNKQGQIPLTVDSFGIKLNAPDFNILETNGEITIKNMVRDREKDCNPSSPFIHLDHLHNAVITANDETFTMAGECRNLDGDRFDLTIRSHS